MNDNYQIEKEEQIDSLNTKATLLRHKKSGARVLLMENDDDNKVFGIGFRTPVSDSTGVPHILEHSVLCGSKKYPVNDPFMQLAKSSLKTFLNAMTFPDKTLYPVASCNDKDLRNLMSVYMDAVFNPNIYIEEKIFKQEGVRYELENADDELKLNGVVYSEMKGAFSDPDSVLERYCLNSLYPDTTYGFESGGDPEVIPTLTYEGFVNFHKRYYHPSNSYIYLYGNMDMDEQLRWLNDEYLSKYDRAEVDSEIKRQNAFDKPALQIIDYPISKEEEPEGKTWISTQWSVGDTLDNELYYALQILEYVLVGAEGAPLRKALIKSGIAEDVLGDQLADIYQPFFRVMIKNTDPDKKDEFLRIVDDTLRDLVQNGIDKRSLEAAINNMEFRIREADFGGYPKGLVYLMQSLESWLYDDNEPIMHLKFEDTFAFFKEHMEDGYFEGLIEKYFIENTHKSIVVLNPVPGLADKNENELKEKLAKYKASLTDEEIQNLIKQTEELRAYQTRKESPEALATLPHLELSDIKREVKELNIIEEKDGETTYLFTKANTNGITYINMLYDINDFSIEEVKQLALLRDIIGLMDTDNYSYEELSDEVNLKLGGISYAVVVRDNFITKVDEKYFEITAKFLHEKREDALELINEISLHTIFDDEERLTEILKQVRSRVEMRSQGFAHGFAIGRALSYECPGDAYKEASSGVDYLRFIREVTENIEEEVPKIIDSMKSMIDKVFDDSRLRVFVTDDEEGYAEMKALFAKNGGCEYVRREPNMEASKPVKKNEGFKTPSQVNYVAMAGLYDDAGLTFNGGLMVLRAILSNEYLWNALRVKGGAYGAMCSFGYSGKAGFVSYRDPKLKETLDVYRKMADYVASFEADERTMSDFIISVIGVNEMPMTPSQFGQTALSNYISGLTKERRQQTKDEVLSCDVERIRSFAKYIERVVEKNQICTVGSAVSIEEAADEFMKVENLL